MVRLLALNGQASSATRIVSSSLSYHSLTVQDSATEGYLNFARSTYFGTITAAHRAGLTALADLLYMQAVSEGVMEWAVKENTDHQVTLDLHGTNVAVAVAGVRVGLRETFRTLPESGMPSIMIVTGRGLNSKTKFKPVLRGEVQDLLINEVRRRRVMQQKHRTFILNSLMLRPPSSTRSSPGSSTPPLPPAR
jgi:hypothetical protein